MLPKMKNLLKSALFPLILTGVFIFFSQKSFGQNAWTAPAKAGSVVNPIKTSPASIAAGKSLWTRHCQSCHGKSGLGDGSKAAQLKTEPGDFTIAKFQGQSDGSIFYKTMEGREDMPSFKKKIPDPDDIWNLVNFIRTLKK